MTTEKSGFLTLRQAADFAHVGESTLRRKIKEGDLNAYRPGKHLLIDPKDLEKFIKKSKVAS